MRCNIALLFRHPRDSARYTPLLFSFDSRTTQDIQVDFCTLLCIPPPTCTSVPTQLSTHPCMWAAARWHHCQRSSLYTYSSLTYMCCVTWGSEAYMYVALLQQLGWSTLELDSTSSWHPCCFMIMSPELLQKFNSKCTSSCLPHSTDAEWFGMNFCQSEKLTKISKNPKGVCSQGKFWGSCGDDLESKCRQVHPSWSLMVSPELGQKWEVLVSRWSDTALKVRKSSLKALPPVQLKMHFIMFVTLQRCRRVI